MIQDEFLSLNAPPSRRGLGLRRRLSRFFVNAFDLLAATQVEGAWDPEYGIFLFNHLAEPDGAPREPRRPRIVR